MNKKVNNVIDLDKARNKKKVTIKKTSQNSKPKVGIVNSLCSKIKKNFNSLAKPSFKNNSVKSKQPLSRKQKLAIINHIVSYYKDGASFLNPQYIAGTHSQEQLYNLELPLVYVWQESISSNGQLDFNCGINKKKVNVLLKSMLAPAAIEFQEIQSKVISSLKNTAIKQIIKKSIELKKLPSEFLSVLTSSIMDKLV